MFSGKFHSIQPAGPLTSPSPAPPKPGDHSRGPTPLCSFLWAERYKLSLRTPETSPHGRASGGGPGSHVKSAGFAHPRVEQDAGSERWGNRQHSFAAAGTHHSAKRVCPSGVWRRYRSSCFQVAPGPCAWRLIQLGWPGSPRTSCLLPSSAGVTTLWPVLIHGCRGLTPALG